jgi:hypothetical protein
VLGARIHLKVEVAMSKPLTLCSRQRYRLWVRIAFLEVIVLCVR